MLALSRGPRNCSVEPARRMEKIGTGLSMLRLAPSKSGLYSPPTPTMTVQVPDTDGTMGNSKEFIARVRAVLRRAPPVVPSAMSFGSVERRVGTNEPIVANKKVLLRRREALILAALLMRSDRVVTRAALIEEIYGFDDEIESNTLEAQVSRLRKKLAELGGDIEIRSMRGIGYILRMTQIR